MNEFVIPGIRETAAAKEDRVYPLERAVRLKNELARVFSYHLGSMESGARFETESILVTGQSGCGKTELKRYTLDAQLLSDCMARTTELEKGHTKMKKALLSIDAVRKRAKTIATTATLVRSGIVRDVFSGSLNKA